MQFFGRSSAIFLSILLTVTTQAGQPNPITGLLSNADVEAGRLGINQCIVCHTLEPDQPHRIGPNLWGIVDRSIATAGDFEYSDALMALEGKWDFEALNRFLYAPALYAPGTKMVFPGIKNDAQRANLIAHLRTLSDTPVALPHGAPTHSTERVMADDALGAGWPQGPGRDLTGYTCNACHSLAIVKQQRLSRDDWDELLDWMIEEQGMAELTTDQRDQILSYLSTNFGY